MSMREFRDYNGRLLAYIEESSNGDQTLYDFFGRTLGRYISSLDATTDFFGKIIGRGNVLASLCPTWEEINNR